MKRTPLFDAHLEADARLVDFAGWEMPVLYTSVIDEHLHCRAKVGLFDVSHMGEIVFRGPGAAAAVNRLIANDLQKVGVGRAVYSPMCQPDGGIVDDVIAYWVEPEHVLMCVNAANRDKDWRWIAAHTAGAPDCEVVDEGERWAQIAVQGPGAPELLARFFGPEWRELPPFRVRQHDFEGARVVVATTGYTGERGGEIYVPTDAALPLWRALVAKGADLEPRPIGLGARDTLRLEYKYCLYGHDIDETTNPYEAGLGWTVKLGHDFIGRDALAVVKQAGGPTRRLVGFALTDKGVPRQGYPLVAPDGAPIGTVTSGTMSPSLGKPIGLGYVATAFAEVGTVIGVDIRGRARAARVVETPFVRKES